LAIGVLAILTAAVTACSSGGNDQPAGPGDPITVRLAHVLETTHPQHVGAEVFAERVEELTNGRVKVNIYPQGQLGGDEALQESVGNGSVHMAIVGNTAALQPITSLFRLPFLFEDEEQAFAVLDGEIGEKVFSSLLENNIRVLAVFHNGFRQVTNNVRPIESVADFAGLKLRVPGSDVYLNLFNALGANPTPMDFTEVYTALEQRVIDGQENPIAVIVSSRLAEVQEYLAITNHMYTAAPFIVNEQFWSQLDADTQEAFRQAAQEARDAQREAFMAAEAQQLQELIDAGMKVTYPSVAELQAATESVYERFYEQFPEAEEMVAAIRDAA
jgi:tripartite ATP-independent transporter DctP family solute receptor